MTAAAPKMQSSSSRLPLHAMWREVDRLVGSAPGPDHLWWHGLHLIAARRWQEQGRPIDADLADAARLAALRVVSAPLLLERVRAVVDGPLVLMKGYEVALLYEDPELRPFIDLDLLVEDSSASQRALVAAGFEEVLPPDLFVDIHHQRPLMHRDLPLRLELHHEPKWPDRLDPPEMEELIAAAVPSRTGIDGISTLPPAHHALLLAAHSWAHLPLRRIQELADIEAVAAGAERGEVDALAQEWGIAHLWRTTKRSAESLFYGSRKTSAQMIWARHLTAARERTVFESHVQKWFSAFWSLPAHVAFPMMVAAIGREFTAAEDESWRDKADRVGRALRNASVPRTKHDEQLGPGAHRRARR